ncbi:MAG: FlgD immunoglobulin-like domain containing protein, partial [bacterium]
DEVGVFTSNGLCVGATILTDTAQFPLIAWTDDPQTPSVDGYANGDTIYFRFWDASQSLDIEARPDSFLAGNGTFGFGALTRINMLFAITNPSEVELVSPSAGTVIEADSVRFEWRKSGPEVDRYWFELAKDTNRIIIDSTLTDTTKVVRQLLDRQIYSWRVKARNAAGWGPFSAPRQFRIDVGTGIYSASENIPREFSLSQNSPNPFNPSTTIEYELPQQVEVKLLIFDILGQHVRTLVNQTQQAGHYAITWDGRNENGQQVASGTFLYQLRAGNFVQTRRMALVR